MKWAVACVAVCACGRVNFDPLTEETTDDSGTATDAASACASWSAWSTPALIPTINSSALDWAPSISDDDLRLIFSSDRIATGNFELFTTVRSSATATDWSPPARITELAMAGPEEDDPTMSSNELELFYGNTLIFQTTRATTSDPWGPTSVLVPNIHDFVQGAELTRDDLRLYFAAGSPNEDLYLMERATPTAAFGGYAMVMPDPDPGSDTGYPTLSADELELYMSADHGGERDLFVSRRTSRSDPFPQVTRDDALSAAGTEDWDPELSKDGTAIYLATDRSGSQGLDLFVATRTCND
jgi:hypothetical protein